jgi:hypothetical protein
MVRRIGGKSPAIDTSSAQKTRDTKLPKKNAHFSDIQIPQALPLAGQRGNVPIEKTLENLKEEFVSILMVSYYWTSQF